jgi:hypothetical protein
VALPVCVNVGAVMRPWMLKKLAVPVLLTSRLEAGTVTATLWRKLFWSGEAREMSGVMSVPLVRL